MKTTHLFTAALVSIGFCISGQAAAASAEEASARYASMLDQLRTELTAKLPDTRDEAQLEKFLASDALDVKLAKYVVLLEATPQGLQGSPWDLQLD